MNKEDIRNKIKIGETSISDNLVNDIVQFENCNEISLSKMFPKNEAYKKSLEIDKVIKKLNEKGAEKVVETFFYTDNKDKDQIFKELLSEIKDTENKNEFILENAYQLAFALCYFKETYKKINFEENEIKLENLLVWTYEKDENQKYTKYNLKYDFYVGYINFISEDALLHRKYSNIHKLLKFNNKSFKFSENEILLEPYFTDEKFVCEYFKEPSEDDTENKSQIALLNFILKKWQNKENNIQDIILKELDFKSFFGFEPKEKVYPNEYAYIKKEINSEGVEEIIISEQIPEWIATWVNSCEEKIEFLSYCGLNTKKSDLLLLRKHLEKGKYEITDTQIATIGDLMNNKQLLVNSLFWLSTKPPLNNEIVISTLERIYSLFKDDINFPIITITDFENEQYYYTLKVLTSNQAVYTDIESINKIIRKTVIVKSSKQIIHKIHNNLFETENLETKISFRPNTETLKISAIQPKYIIQFNLEQINEDKKIIICDTTIPLNQTFEKEIIQRNQSESNFGYNNEYIYINKTSIIEKELENRYFFNNSKLERLKTLKRIFRLKKYLQDENKKSLFGISFNPNTNYTLNDFKLENENQFFLFEKDDNIIDCEYSDIDKRLSILSDIYKKQTAQDIKYSLFFKRYNIKNSTYIIKNIDDFDSIFYGLEYNEKDYSEYKIKIWEETKNSKVGFVSIISIPEHSKEISVSHNDFDTNNLEIKSVEIINKLSYTKTFFDIYQIKKTNNQDSIEYNQDDYIRINYIVGDIPYQVTFYNDYILKKYKEGFFYKEQTSNNIYINIIQKSRTLDILLDKQVIDLDEFTKLSADPTAVYKKIKEENGYTDEQMSKFMSKLANMTEDEINSIEEPSDESDKSNVTENEDKDKEDNTDDNDNDNRTGTGRTGGGGGSGNRSGTGNMTYSNFITGQAGEELVYKKLATEFKEENFIVKWNNKGKDGGYDDKKEPWDIEITNKKTKKTIYIDAKTTVTTEENTDRISFIITKNEWSFLKGQLQKYGNDMIENYYVARVFDIDGNPVIRYLKLTHTKMTNKIFL